MSAHFNGKKEGASENKGTLENQSKLSIGQKVERCNRLASQNWNKEREQLRHALPLPELMHKIGFGDHAQKSAFCPFHLNTRTQAFSVWPTPKQDFRWKCHAKCGEGDEIDFLKKALNLSYQQARKLWKELAEGASLSAQPVTPLGEPPASVTVSERAPVQLSDLYRGNRNDLEAVARLREVSLDATRIMDRMGFLRFGTLWGVKCWVLCDHSGRLAEARRLDGTTFSRGEKVRSLRNSVKSFPLGLVPPPQYGLLHPCAQILLTEGSGDFVAGFHFCLLNGPVKWQPVSVLGKNSIHPDALPLFANRSVLIVPHVDPDGGGMEAAQRWYEQLTSVGCDVRKLNLEGLRQRDGTPIKDLNDCVHLGARQMAELEEVFA